MAFVYLSQESEQEALFQLVSKTMTSILQFVKELLITTTNTVDSTEEIETALFQYLKQSKSDLKTPLMSQINDPDGTFFDGVFCTNAKQKKIERPASSPLSFENDKFSRLALPTEE